MDKLKYLIPVIAVLLNSGCASFGPTVRIETPEPAEDFVLLCYWFVDPLFGFHGSGAVSKKNIYVVKSGDETHCGVALTGGRTATEVMHPLYSFEKITEEDGITVHRFAGNKLDYLDKQKEKFEAGFWDERSDPGIEYADNLVGCSFPHQYFDYYNEVKTVDIERFKLLYHKPISECLKRTMPILKKYRSRKYKKFPDAEYYIQHMWDTKKWSKQDE